MIMSDYQFKHKPLHENVLRIAGLRSKKSAMFGMVRTNKDGSPRPHQGIDLAVDNGYRVYAVDDGVIADVARGNDGYGWTVTLKIKDGLYAFYAHLSSIKCQVGQQVKAGDRIALSGSTGNAKGMINKAKGSHLHFEVRTTAKPGLGLRGRLDPLDYFKLDDDV